MGGGVIGENSFRGRNILPRPTWSSSVTIDLFYLLCWPTLVGCQQLQGDGAKWLRGVLLFCGKNCETSINSSLFLLNSCLVLISVHFYLFLLWNMSLPSMVSDILSFINISVGRCDCVEINTIFHFTMCFITEIDRSLTRNPIKRLIKWRSSYTFLLVLGFW